MKLLQPGLAPAIALAVLGHAAVLSQVPGALRSAPRGEVAGAAQTFPFRMRLVQPAPTAEAAEPPAPLLATADPQAQPAAPAPEAAVQPPVAASTPPAPARTSANPPAAAEPAYVPRGQLTRAPRPLAEVDVPFPPDVSGLVDLRLKVSLFIDETGKVRDVRFDSGAVPPAFARAVVDTFTNARFSPGEINSVAVPAQIRVEVEFHAPSAR